MPRKRKKTDNKQVKRNYTVKSKLHANTLAIHKWLLHDVDVASVCAIHSSRFASIYLLHCIQNSLPLPIINKTFFDRITTLLADVNSQKPPKRKGGDKQMTLAFTTLYLPLLTSHNPSDFKIDRTSSARDILFRLSCEMTTNTENYLMTQFLNRFRNWCKDTIAEIIPIDITGKKSDERTQKLKQRWKLVSYIFQETVCTASTETDESKVLEQVKKEMSVECDQIWSDSVATQIVYKICAARLDLNQTIVVEKKKNGQRVQENVFCRPVTYAKLQDLQHSPVYFRWLAKRLAEIELNNADTTKKQKKTFSLLPINSISERRYVGVDNTTLSNFIHANRNDETVVGKEIFDYLKTKDVSNVNKTWSVFKEKPLWFWERCFKIKSKLGENRSFDCFMTTDGVGCSLLYSKKEVAREEEESEEEEDLKNNDIVTLDSDEERLTDKKIRVFSQEELNNADIIGVDPGRKDLYTSVLEKNDGSGRHHVQQYSNARWQVACGGAKAKKQREKWIKKIDRYEKWMLEMPSCKVSTVAAMEKHVRHLMLMWKVHWDETGKQRIRNLRFTNYLLRQKALANMTNGFINKIKEAANSKKVKTIVAFGDAEFKTCGPVKKMKKELQRRKETITVVDIDEFRTSKMTTCCAFPCGCKETNEGERKEVKAIERAGPLNEVKDKKTGETRREHLYSVTFCQNCSCIWNRDVNAALNMLRIFEHAQTHKGERHLVFKRSSIREVKEAKEKSLEINKKRKTQVTCKATTLRQAGSLSITKTEVSENDASVKLGGKLGWVE